MDPYIAKISLYMFLISLVTGIFFLCVGIIMYWKRLSESVQNSDAPSEKKFSKLNTNEFTMVLYGLTFSIFSLGIYIFKVIG